MNKILLQIEGYNVFIVECANGSYYSDMCKNLDKKIAEMNNQFTTYFIGKPHLVPVKVVFCEKHIPFREAYVKHRYLRTLTKRHRSRLIDTGKWPGGKKLKGMLEKVGLEL
jgi:predicted GIY-YIG superfamily endonuclease